MKTITKQLTRSKERMHTKLDWLDSRHSFSFGGHHDPERMGFGPLRVVNDDVVSPKGGFSPHPHHDMEIVSIVLSGQLEHKDSLGNGRVIKAGDIQYMGAGSGVVHSEFNPSADHPVHLMQIWIEPNEKGLEPCYADRAINGDTENAWRLLLSPDGMNGSVAIRQDVRLSSARLAAGSVLDYRAETSARGFWLFIIEGSVEAGDGLLMQGDSLALSGVEELSLRNPAAEAAQVLLFDLNL